MEPGFPSRAATSLPPHLRPLHPLTRFTRSSTNPPPSHPIPDPVAASAHGHYSSVNAANGPVTNWLNFQPEINLSSSRSSAAVRATEVNTPARPSVRELARTPTAEKTKTRVSFDGRRSDHPRCVTARAYSPTRLESSGTPSTQSR